jgi:hypothetical protein
VPVDLQVGTWTKADYNVVPGIDADVAALGAAGADAGGLVQVPGAGLVEEIL